MLSMTSHSGRQFLFFLAVSVIAVPLLLPTARAAQVACAVTTGTGNVEGLDRGASCEFLGIPYAAPPLGALRWKPPQPAVPWAMTLMATAAPLGCPSLNAAGTPGGDEDCLKLNVWVRDPFPTQPAPVIVWLHTGSFVSASANFASHNGRRLAEETGAIVVAPNYRLGPLGFLVHSALAAEDPAHPVSGNYGLLDQRAALEWVRENIAAFGGDPEQCHACGNIGRRRQRRPAHGLARKRGPLPPRHHRERDTDDTVAEPRGECIAGRRLRQRSRMRGPGDGCLVPANQNLSTVVARAASVHTASDHSRQVVFTGIRSSTASSFPISRACSSQAGQFHQVPTIVGFTRDEGAGFIPRTFPAGVTLDAVRSVGG